MLTSIAAPTIDSERGFLPSQDPLTRLPDVFDAWESAAAGLPKLLVSDHVRRSIEDLPPFPLDRITNDRERERAMTLLSYLGHGYVWRGTRPAEVLPGGSQSHGTPLRKGSAALRCSATAAMPCTISSGLTRSAKIECGNIGLIQNFLGGIDEEWFILIHVDIERKAAPGMAVLHDCLDAAEAADAERLQSLLAAVGPRSTRCTPHSGECRSGAIPISITTASGPIFTDGRTIPIFRAE